jgi:hypothetical protein
VLSTRWKGDVLVVVPVLISSLSFRLVLSLRQLSYHSYSFPVSYPLKSVATDDSMIVKENEMFCKLLCNVLCRGKLMMR